VAGRASIVGAAATHVGNVREHNEDAHFFDADTGLFVVCDGMGGHAAGEVASAIAIRTLRARWASREVQAAIDAWIDSGTPEAKKQLLGIVRASVVAAHDAILAEAAQDDEKSGMGTTLVGAIIVGNELVFAHAGDSRAYIVRDGIAMQLTEDHTLLSRLLAAGIDVDVSGDGARFRSMLTNALGIGQECKVSTFVVPLADGDRFLLCSDGISEYVPEPEVGIVLTSQPSPARAAQKLIELALERGGADNATAVVIRVLEAGDSPRPVEHRRKDDTAIQACALWDKLSPQQRLRALRIALEREVAADERLPAHTLGDRVAWILIEGEVEQHGRRLGPGTLVYPQSLLGDMPAPDRDALAVTRADVRGLVLRADDFREVCDDDAELGELLLETLGRMVSRRGGMTTNNDADVGRLATDADRHPRSRAETSEVIEPPPPVAPPLPITLPDAPPAPKAAPAAAPAPDDEPIPLTAVKTPAPPRGSTPARGTPLARPIVPPAGIGRALTPPVGVPVTSRTAIPIPPLPKLPSVPSVPKPAAPARTDDAVDLGSELRADLGGEHAVPKRNSAPKLAPVAPVAPAAPRRDPTDLEVEIEAVVELEADAPGDDGEHEMTITVDEPDDSDDSDDSGPITSEQDGAVSGSIQIPADPATNSRTKRLSEGWGDD